MQIVDNSPELDLNDPKQAALLNPTDAPVKETPKPEPVAEAKQEPVKEASTEVDEGVDKEAQIKGLKAELSRREGNAARVHELELKLASLEGKQSQSNADPIAEAILKLDDRDLIAKQTDWEDELAAARAKYERAEETQNETALQTAANRITHAKKVLTSLKQEVVDRAERKQVERQTLKEEADTLTSELTGMYEQVNEVFPDFQNPETDLWKAGNEIYKANPTLMKKMGPAGEIVAAAMAILQQGAKGTNTAARKEVLSNIDKGFGKALKAGTSSPNTTRTPDWSAAVTDGAELAKFNAYIDKIKG
jgi:chromosome segregation ATPase